MNNLTFYQLLSFVQPHILFINGNIFEIIKQYEAYVYKCGVYIIKQIISNFRLKNNDIYRELISSTNLRHFYDAVQTYYFNIFTLACQVACLNDNYDVIKLLLEHGANVRANDNYVIQMASKNNNYNVAKLLIEKGAEVNANNNYTLKIASDNNNQDITKLLIENGADIHAVNEYSLKCAVRNGNIEILKLLMNKGANIYSVRNYDIKIALCRGYYDIIKLLMERILNGININNNTNSTNNDRALKWIKKYDIATLLKKEINISHAYCKNFGDINIV